jgi:hypothetical protein
MGGIIKKAVWGPPWPHNQDEGVQWLPADSSGAENPILRYSTEADTDMESLDPRRSVQLHDVSIYLSRGDFVEKDK